MSRLKKMTVVTPGSSFLFPRGCSIRPVESPPPGGDKRRSRIILTEVTKGTRLQPSVGRVEYSAKKASNKPRRNRKWHYKHLSNRVSQAGILVQK